MSHNILVTGASGYLGGTLLARWRSANLPPYQKLYALVRTDEQARHVRGLSAKPLTIDLEDESNVAKSILDNKITIVFFLIDAMNSEIQVRMIKALAEVRKKTGQDVHFLHTSGAKIFSSHTGFPTNGPVSDADPKLYNLSKDAQSPHAIMAQAVNTNKVVIDTAEAHGVKSYIFIPCIVYGIGEGFGNKTSIQTVAIVKAAKKVGRVYKVDTGGPMWPVCHVADNAELYLEILRSILSGESIDHGKNGYYLAASGSVAWDDIYDAMAKGLVSHRAIENVNVEAANEAILKQMGEALGCSPELVPVQLGGRCDLEARHGHRIGWKPQYPPEHILEAANAEVEIILDSLKD